jgi:hypothetical protein
MSTKNEKENKEKLDFALGRENYKLLAIGFGIIVLGFLLMLGGKSDSPDKFSDTIFSFRRITLAPIVILGGFIFEIWAIMKKPKEKESK